tara:strand:- start:3586 stop:3933 length:348 start_codon:yes stop_codon:yes gene_type:complete
MFSFNSYAEWTKIATNSVGDTYYIDFERINKIDGYIYIWQLDNYLEPISSSEGIFYSSLMLKEVDCKLSRWKRLYINFYTKLWSEGNSIEGEPDSKWLYAIPNSTSEGILNSVCK